MLSRFNAAPLLRGHWKGLTDGRYVTYRADWGARAVFAVPGVVAVLVWALGGHLAAPTPLLTAVALLAGGMLSAFTHLSTLRLKITEWVADDDDRLVVEREMLDETAAHLLAGSLLCLVDAMVLVVGMNIGANKEGHLQGVWAGLAAGLTLYIFLVFVVILPRLYSAYVQINQVTTRLSGFAKGRG